MRLGLAATQSSGPPPPQGNHLPIESGLPCSATTDQPPSSFVVTLSPEQEARALAVYSRSVVITAHDHCFDPGDFSDMEAAGITVRTIKPTVDGIYITGAKRYRIDEAVDGWFERGSKALDILDSRIAESRGKVSMIRSVGDIERAKREHKLGIIYSFEGGRPLAGKLDNLEVFYKRGLREMQLFWAVPSPLKSPTQTLSDFGLAVLREMNRLGIVIDLSHMPDLTFQQAIDTTTAPIVISHCAVAAVSGVKSRGTDQLSDDAVRQVAKNGGAICLHFYEGYIRPRHGEHATVVDLVDHIDHIKRLVGIDSVALGSDYFPEKGWRFVEGVEKMRGLPNVVREMVHRGYSDEDIEKVLGRNLMRIYGKVWKK